ncbi:hypothetical protein CMUST_03825 [Corynebacterium mustelae]|uniref:Imm33-like domain-containing protein n=1 Tax=Corynebacterium mustelae TaxID=571915 RepID=A0A0G3GVF7_9CORY|nr:hypothetical protein [Corynebacterium mustelae]AKK05109.1 hypothetical protein CMUST_03825 [Corynebacterium mustelae]
MKTPKEICDSVGCVNRFPAPGSRIALALSSLGKIPTYGARLIPKTTNPNEITWYIHCGENPGDADFYDVVCIEHLAEKLPQALPYLGLDYGYRFIIDDNGYEDIYHEDELKD